MNRRRTTSHTEIKHWATERGAKPALSYVLTQQEGGKLEKELVFVFSDSISESAALKFLDWDKFLRIFDKQRLYLLYDEVEQKSDYYSFEQLENLESFYADNSKNWQQRTKTMVYK